MSCIHRSKCTFIHYKRTYENIFLCILYLLNVITQHKTVGTWNVFVNVNLIIISIVLTEIHNCLSTAEN